jgi:hypothetical protein
MIIHAYYSKALDEDTISHSRVHGARGRACVGEAAEFPLRAQLARALLPQPIAAPTVHAAQRERTIASCCSSSPCAPRTACAPSTVSSKAGTSSTSTPTPRRLTARPMAAGRGCTPASGSARLHQRAESAAVTVVADPRRRQYATRRGLHGCGGAAGIPLGQRRRGGCVVASGCADGACDLGHAARTDGEHAQQQVPQRGKHGCRVPAMHLCDAHWSLSSAAKVQPVRVRGGKGRARLGGAWLARAGGSGCVRRNGQRVGLACAGLRQHYSSVQGGALQPSL